MRKKDTERDAAVDEGEGVGRGISLFALVGGPTRVGSCASVQHFNRCGTRVGGWVGVCRKSDVPLRSCSKHKHKHERERYGR